MRLFSSGGSPHQTGLAMVGAKAGDAVLVIGAHDHDFCAEIARVTGLNGRTVVADPAADAAARLEAAGGRAGGLVEFVAAPPDRLPLDTGTFDIVVLQGPLAARQEATHVPTLAEAARVLRPGGRAVLIEGSRRTGLLSGWRSAPPAMTDTAVRALLERAGMVAIRPLATTGGITYWEGRK